MRMRDGAGEEHVACAVFHLSPRHRGVPLSDYLRLASVLSHHVILEAFTGVVGGGYGSGSGGDGTGGGNGSGTGSGTGGNGSVGGGSGHGSGGVGTGGT